MGPVKHERKELRHPEKNTLQAIRFDYVTETRGSVVVTPDHDKAVLAFRLLNASGFEILNTTWPAPRIKTELLDELAKLIVGEPNRFCLNAMDMHRKTLSCETPAIGWSGP